MAFKRNVITIMLYLIPAVYQPPLAPLAFKSNVITIILYLIPAAPASPGPPGL